jgi:hypothetical protein
MSMMCINIIRQEPKETTHESKPGAGGGKSRAGRRGSWPAVPREGVRGHGGRRDHEGRRPDGSQYLLIILSHAASDVFVKQWYDAKVPVPIGSTDEKAPA